jgi:hypothetical protein
MTCPQCPQIKSSPPVPDILRSVRRIERFNVVTRPTGIMGMVAICSPNQNFVLERSRERSSKAELAQPDFITCHIFASGGCGFQIETLEWSLVKRSIDSNSKTHDKSRLKEYSSFNARYFG